MLYYLRSYDNIIQLVYFFYYTILSRISDKNMLRTIDNSWYTIIHIIRDVLRMFG